MLHSSARRLVLGLLLVLAISRVSVAEPVSVEVAVPGAAAGEPVDAAMFVAWRAWLIDGGFGVDRCGVDEQRGIMTLHLEDERQLDALVEQGFTVVADESGATRGSIDPQYFDPGEIASMLNQVAADHPSIARLFTVGTSPQGRTIYGIEISDQPGVTEDEPSIQFNGQHHAREVATSHVVMDVVNHLTDNYGVDSEVTGWVNAYKTICVPMVNPDGVQYTFDVDNFWRKNRSANGCVGVDLNRNYPYLWGPGCGGSSSSCSSDVFRGPTVASELETQAMRSLVDEWHFVMATSYHSFGQFIDYPYACYNGNPSGQMPEHAVIAEMMQGVRAGIIAAGGPAYAANTTASAGPLTGDDTSWYYAHKGTYPFIIEIGTSFEPPFSQVGPMVTHNRGGWKYMIRRLGQARLDVYANDACNGEPMEADVTLTNYVYDTGELPRTTFMPYGRWTYVVRPNTNYTVRASKAGYVTQDMPVFVAGLPQAITISLERTAPPPFGDTDCDGDVDMADAALMLPCLSGPEISYGEDCKGFNADDDGDVDLADFAVFQLAFTG